MVGKMIKYYNNNNMMIYNILLNKDKLRELKIIYKNTNKINLKIKDNSN